MALIVAPEEIINHRFRRGASGKKDRLDKDAGRAHTLGMSYGKYKALEQEGKLPANAQAAQEEDDDTPAPAPVITGTVNRRYVHVVHPDRPCEYCGKIYTPRANNSKYCCDYCRGEAKKENVRVAKKAAREAQA